MKFKTTKKAIMNSYSTIVKAGYCDLQYLLTFENPVAYTCGAYGWNADIYQFGNVAIVTGYRPFGNILPGYDTDKRYEDMARKIRCSDMPYEE